MELPLENVFIVESKAHDSTTRIRVSFWKICPGYPENQDCFSLPREARAVRNKRWPLQVGLLLSTSASRGKGGEEETCGQCGLHC